MPKITPPPVSTCVWTGKSGTKYTYYDYPILHVFDANEDGNYIFVRVADNQSHPVYIGEGNLTDRNSEQHHQSACIKSKGATRFHAHPNPVKANRKAEEEYLLANYTQAYSPTGCNVKEGG